MMKKYEIEMRYPPAGNPTDTTFLFNLLRDLDIELLAVPEIVDPPLFVAMAKRHLGNRFEFVYVPFSGWQKTGFLYDSSILRLIGEPQTHWEVSHGMEERLRPDWQKPELQSSLIDQIFISRSARFAYILNSLEYGSICRQNKKIITGEFPAYYRNVSEHCPLRVSFRPFPDND